MEAAITWTLNKIHASESPNGLDDKNLRALDYTVTVEKDDYVLTENRIFHVEGSPSDMSFFDSLSEDEKLNWVRNTFFLESLEKKLVTKLSKVISSNS